jgi:ankyrin repeat protein
MRTSGAPVSAQAPAETAPVHGHTPLILASASGQEDVVIGLLAQRPPLEAKDGTGATGLMRAVIRGHSEIARLLLSAGANPNTANQQKTTPLMAAILKGDRPMVDLLMAHRPDIEARTAAGIAALHLAAAEGQVAIVRRLLMAGAQVNKPDHNGWTPLAAAAARGHLDIVRLLVDKGAEINPGLKTRASAIDLARAGNHARIEELLRHAVIEKAIQADVESSEFRQLRTNLYAVEHPSGWQAFRDSGSSEVCLAACGALHRSEDAGVQIGYGSILSYYPARESRPDLAGSTGEMIRELLEENPDMDLESSPWSAAAQDHPALVTPLVGNSPFGGAVRELVVTVARPEGLFCMFFVAPPRAWPAVGNVFDRMLGSLQFSVDANGFAA